MVDVPWQVELRSAAWEAEWEFDPTADVRRWRLQVPARGGCFALFDAADQPVQLSIAGNLRDALVHRLGPRDPAEDDGPTKRIDFRAMVRRVRYRTTTRRFESEWVWLENARTLQPSEFQQTLRQWRSHWVCIRMADAHPRFVTTDEPPDEAACFGPVRDAKTAQRAVQVLEDVFDLCREHPRLVRSPHAEACSYKQMGRCPAPCDGSVSMESYRGQLAEALAFLEGDRRRWRQHAVDQMARAAAEHRYEQAGRWKRRIEDAAELDRPAFAHLRPLGELRFLLLTGGQGKGSLRAYLLKSGCIEALGQISRPQRGRAMDLLAEHAAKFWQTNPAAESAPHRTCLIARTILSPERRPMTLLPPREAIDAARLAEAAESLVRFVSSSRQTPGKLGR